MTSASTPIVEATLEGEMNPTAVDNRRAAQQNELGLRPQAREMH